MSFRRAMKHERTGAAKRLLLALVLLVAAAALPAQSFAQTINCNDAPYNGLIDGTFTRACRRRSRSTATARSATTRSPIRSTSTSVSTRRAAAPI